MNKKSKEELMKLAEFDAPAAKKKRVYKNISKEFSEILTRLLGEFHMLDNQVSDTEAKLMALSWKSPLIDELWLYDIKDKFIWEEAKMFATAVRAEDKAAREEFLNDVDRWRMVKAPGTRNIDNATFCHIGLEIKDKLAKDALRELDRREEEGIEEESLREEKVALPIEELEEFKIQDSFVANIGGVEYRGDMAVEAFDIFFEEYLRKPYVVRDYRPTVLVECEEIPKTALWHVEDRAGDKSSLLLRAKSKAASHISEDARSMESFAEQYANKKYKQPHPSYVTCYSIIENDTGADSKGPNKGPQEGSVVRVFSHVDGLPVKVSDIKDVRDTHYPPKPGDKKNIEDIIGMLFEDDNLSKEDKVAFENMKFVSSLNFSNNPSHIDYLKKITVEYLHGRKPKMWYWQCVYKYWREVNIPPPTHGQIYLDRPKKLDWVADAAKLYYMLLASEKHNKTFAHVARSGVKYFKFTSGGYYVKEPGPVVMDLLMIGDFGLDDFQKLGVCDENVRSRDNIHHLSRIVKTNVHREELVYCIALYSPYGRSLRSLRYRLNEKGLKYITLAGPRISDAMFVYVYEKYDGALSPHSCNFIDYSQRIYESYDNPDQGMSPLDFSFPGTRKPETKYLMKELGLNRNYGYIGKVFTIQGVLGGAEDVPLKNKARSKGKPKITNKRWKGKDNDSKSEE